jgi:hypothetical protein
MRLVTIRNRGREELAVRIQDRVVPVESLNELTGSRFATDMLALLQRGELDRTPPSSARETTSYCQNNQSV